MNHERHYTRENNNNYYTGCYLHPKQVLIGVCPLCLNERLVIIIASRKANGHFHLPSSTTTAKPTSIPPRKPSFSNIFRFLNPFELRNRKSHRSCASSTSQDDSFISMKFEKNGIATWDKSKKSKVVSNKVSLDHFNNMTTWNHNTRKETPTRAIESLQEPKSVIKLDETRVLLRWRKRIGRLCHLINWKRSNKGNVGHAGRVKVRKGWINFFTRRTKNS